MSADSAARLFRKATAQQLIPVFKSLVAQEHVDYARDREICLSQVNKKKYQAAFFLNPTTVEQVQRVALLGERMPQKSTDFYPKMLSGLTMYAMD